MEDRYETNIDDLWSAVTDPHRLARWIADVQGDLQVGGEAHLLAQSDQLTRLVIEERGLPLDELAAHGAGWQAHVEDLGAYLAGQASANWQARWEELTPSYSDLAQKL